LQTTAPSVFSVVECGHKLIANNYYIPCFSVFKLTMLQAYFLFSDTNSQSNFGCFFLMQFYTFLVTTLVTLSLLPQFLAFFTVGEKIGTPETLVATFVTFGKLDENLYIVSIFISFLFPFPFPYFYALIISVLNLSFALSIMGFLIMHISLVLGNTTTIEVMPFAPPPPQHRILARHSASASIKSSSSFFQAFEKKSNPKWHYDLGRRKNFEQVTFGLSVNLYPTTVYACLLH
jgi:palmitoyltransferase